MHLKVNLKFQIFHLHNLTIRRLNSSFIISPKSKRFNSVRSMTNETDIKSPPRAKKIDHKFQEMFGMVRNDPYYWLRDDERKNPEVLEHLKLENEYTESVMSKTKQFQEKVFKELKEKIKEDDVSVPFRKDDYFYYTRTEKDKQYKVRCRRKFAGNKHSFDLNEKMDENSIEEILLDENEESKNHEFYMVGSFEISPNHELFAYGLDTSGSEKFKLIVKEIKSNQIVESSHVENLSYEIEWANDNKTIFYVSRDEVDRPYKVWRHIIGSQSNEDVCVFHEKDEKFSVGLSKSASDKFIFIESASSITSDARCLSADDPFGEWKEIVPRQHGVDFNVYHRGNNFFIIRRCKETYNSELFVCHIDDVENKTLLIQHRPTVKIEGIKTFVNHLVVLERENGLQNIIIYHLPNIDNDIKRLNEGKKIIFDEEAYSLSSQLSNYHSPILRYLFTSLKTPNSVYDYDMNSNERVLRKMQPILGGFDSENYETKRLWAKADDDTCIPISLVYRKDKIKSNGPNPLFLDGYGSYEICNDPDFDFKRLVLLDRGIVFAIAHIRGGGEMGRTWYEDGKYLKKKNTFHDFITCAQFLIQNNWTIPDMLSIHGRSAGGLLMGSVLNLNSNLNLKLFKCAIVGVPFVDVLTTMLDASIPLTTMEWEEWGNPSEKEYFHYMHSYSPYDNVTPNEYPHIFVTAGLHDPRVAYWEPAKWVSKLREFKKDKNFLIFKCDLGAGHFSKSGRFDKLKEVALEFTFLLDCFGLVPKEESIFEEH